MSGRRIFTEFDRGPHAKGPCHSFSFDGTQYALNATGEVILKPFQPDISLSQKGRNLFSAARHVVDEGAVDVCAARANSIQQCFEIGHEVLCVRKLVIDDMGITGLTQHHQASRNPDGFSSRAPGHVSYTDPFCSAVKKSSASRSIPHR